MSKFACCTICNYQTLSIMIAITASKRDTNDNLKN